MFTTYDLLRDLVFALSLLTWMACFSAAYLGSMAWFAKGKATLPGRTRATRRAFLAFVGWGIAAVGDTLDPEVSPKTIVIHSALAGACAFTAAWHGVKAERLRVAAEKPATEPAPPASGMPDLLDHPSARPATVLTEEKK